LEAILRQEELDSGKGELDSGKTSPSDAGTTPATTPGTKSRTTSCSLPVDDDEEEDEDTFEQDVSPCYHRIFRV